MSQHRLIGRDFASRPDQATGRSASGYGRTVIAAEPEAPKPWVYWALLMTVGVVAWWLL